MKEVWVVDDDEEMAKAVSLMLQLLDYTAKHFLNPRPAAQALLAGKKPDLLILDINMPEVTGLDMLEFLRRRDEWKNLPIIMLSSEAADVMVEKAMQLGADAYVIKPVLIEELEKAMSQAFYRNIKR
ncbi:MAG TPA: two-component system response regulator [Anaerolineae bacterium]|nr:two-component system response regulator [Anaerolineae bacterium]HCR70884.1 two-component system response regulator [Anaerolineae bacterium]